MELEYISWDDVDRMCEKLAQMIHNSGFTPDIIIGIGRGGWIPARLLSDALGIKGLFAVRVEFYKSIGKTGGRKPVITQRVPKRIFKGKKVLVVDDVADTGGSLLTIKGMLSGAGEVRTAALHFKPTSKIKPDFFVETTSAWLVYPWEKYETRREQGEGVPQNF